ncbi:NAD(P)/FAD-dependent oxidoreductase [Allosphingosinicella indica]|uniref:Thioredoxin reductase n=1 Tax=Allosphingosinicella indica TaxID=941907 RepID=A0A1X7G0X5_9SPHN|nr:NAD(P)/FAD-dependent oxidoreductase [Allosphingosinicella indica]SMF61906.1 Thioredoxin reductase [Allosphingosinicella indica]
MAEAYDLVIVGGGPAGQAAALALDGSGVRIAVVDEQPRPGGQILRRPPAAFRVRDWLQGHEYGPLKKQLAAFEALRNVEWLGGRSVLGLAREDGGFALSLSGPEGASRLTAPRVLIAAGCQDLAVPVPGWTLPGVYTAGGLQTLLKSQQIVPGERILLAGTHPLQLVIAEQIVAAGGTLAAVLFAQPRAVMLRTSLAHPGAALAHPRNLLAAAHAERALRRAGVPLLYGHSLDAITGEGRVGAVTTDTQTIACDSVGLCYGFVPQSALPRMAGARMRPAGRAGGWAAEHDYWMRSSVPGLWVAGETTGVAGAPAAMAAGRIAGIGIARDSGTIDAQTAERGAASARRDHAKRLGFARLLDAVADPRGYWPAADTNLIACRCENVTFGAIDAAIADGGTANAVKLATRCGMGPCQGRNCEPTLLRRLADAGRPEDPGFAQRFPARPVPIGDLAAPPGGLPIG